MEKEDERRARSSPRHLASRESKTIKLALTGVLTGAYAVATIALGTVSFGVVNLRFSNILLGVVPIFGWPGVFGIALGVLLGNFASPLGPIDYLSAFFSLIGLTAMYHLRNRSVLAGLLIYGLILTIWVSFELSFLFHLPYTPTFYAVAAGMGLVLALAYLFYKALVRTGLKRRVDGVLN